MAYPLQHIKSLRKRYHLTQKQLADLAQVSQSLIAKIEAGRIDPGYSKAQQVFSALEQLRQQKEVKAKDVLNPRIITVRPTDRLKLIIATMKQKSISQVPVVAKNRVLGLVTEAAIVEKLVLHPERFSALTAAEVMQDAPPIVSPATGIKTLLELLKDGPIVLVAEKGELRGLISKSDVLGKME